jgi:hypothetical protein
MGQPKGRAGQAETGAAGSEVGHGSLDSTPEAFVMAGMAYMRQLMDEDVVDKVGRELHRGPVDVELALGGAGAPAVAERQHTWPGNVNFHAERPRAGAPAQP